MNAYTAATTANLSRTYDYNAANQRTRVAREDNAYWSFAYDALGQITSGSRKRKKGNEKRVGL